MTMLDNKKFLFIIGSPRSGTSWLQKMLASHPAIVSTVETTMYAGYLAPLLKQWRAEKRNIDERRWIKGLPHLLSEEEFLRTLYPLLEASYQAISGKKPEATHILDKAPENTFHIDTILKFVPDAKFIHIIRDGRDVVCSMRNVKRKVGHQTEDIGKGASLWRDSILTAKRDLADSPNYVEVLYEDLLDKTNDILTDIFEFCEISTTETQIKAICEEFTFENMRRNLPTADPNENIKGSAGHYHKGKAGTWREELSPTDFLQFCDIGGELLTELGYADQGWVQSIFEQRTNQKHLLHKLKRMFRARTYYFVGLLFGTQLANRILSRRIKKTGK